MITETGRHRVKGVHSYGTCVMLDDGSSIAVSKVRKIIHADVTARIEQNRKGGRRSSSHE